LVRVDILIKNGKSIELVEVKAKSISSEDSFWQSRKKELDSRWSEYIADVAFQTWVASNVLPGTTVSPYLMLADKDSPATRDGLHQLFLLKSDERGRTSAIYTGSETEDLGKPILKKVDVLREVRHWQERPEFESEIKSLVKSIKADKPLPAPVNTACKHCEFSEGFTQCMKEAGLSDEELAKPLIFDIWNIRGYQDLLDEQVYLQEDIDLTQLPKKSGDGAFSPSERQWFQIDHAKGEITGTQLLQNAIDFEISRLTWPLHFIDFETTTVAVPFFAGMLPYEQVAFQFSHHILHQDGRIEHRGEYLHPDRSFPNFHFVRALKAQLETDSGSIFRYSAHENTVLNKIHEQLANSDEADSEELMTFIESITHKDKRIGQRDMVDLLEWVKRYYWHPRMGGSNSIKDVLPAVMQDAPAKLQAKFPDWFKYDEDSVPKDPYKLLPRLFEDLDARRENELMLEDTLSDGSAAMTAYSRLQFEEMPDWQAQKIREALLRYCHLDTLAMVMVFWRFYNVRT
jgi:hypothetical protein